MSEKEFLKLKNQIKEIYDLCHELNVYFSGLKKEIIKLSEQVTEFSTPPVLDFSKINLNGELHEFQK